ncbi:hypothetical protein LZ32DRAFT_667819 [Colletotrichum eremochloae]|nr:hypothetical protein LZ32DRAFT_667819 [Colletotrichum eremochloae]
MRAFTSSSFTAIALLVASAQGFSQEFTFTEGDPCLKQQDGDFFCNQNISGKVQNAVMVSFRNQTFDNGTIGPQINLLENLTFDYWPGVKIDCGGPTNYTFIVNGQDSWTPIGCTGTFDTWRVNNIFSVKPIEIPYLEQGSEDVGFVDGDTCQQQADGSYLCSSSGAKISEENGVGCTAGSSVYFVSGGDSGNFTQPLCANGFTEVRAFPSF